MAATKGQQANSAKTDGQTRPETASLRSAKTSETAKMRGHVSLLLLLLLLSLGIPQLPFSGWLIVYPSRCFVCGKPRAAKRQPSNCIQQTCGGQHFIDSLVLATQWRIKMSEFACSVWHELGSKLVKWWVKVASS